MSAVAPPALTLAELEQIVHAVAPSALLVLPRLLRRIISKDRGVGGLGLAVPHRKSYVIDRDALMGIVSLSELGATARELPERLILLAQPDEQRLASRPIEESLRRLWRLLFHARIHLALDQRMAEGVWTAGDIRQRIHALGAAEFNEVREVLRQENYLLPPEVETTTYVEFAALYLELRYFARPLLSRYFPTLKPFERIDELLAADLDAEVLYQTTRLGGVADPEFPPEENEADEPQTTDEPISIAPSEPLFRRLIHRAKRAARVGNQARAAILRQRAALAAAPERAAETAAAARAELDRLAVRVGAALGLDERQTAAWRRALYGLLRPAARGVWPAAARLLYDVQAACVERERGVFEVDLVAWVVSLGRTPLKRPLPNQPDVSIVKHLRSAARRLGAARIDDGTRRALTGLLGRAIEQSEEHLRDRFRPLLAGSVAAVGLEPADYPERIASKKLTEELLDTISERGHLNMGQVRDAISRNRLNLPDLSGPREFVAGDPLLRVDRRFAAALDSVYHRGEFYLRWLQRFSALAFGTRPGRFFTRFLALPFGGAFVVLEGVQHVLHLIVGHHVHITNLISVIVTGWFFMALLYLPRMRRRLGHLLGLAFRALIDVPALIWRQPFVRALLTSRPVRFLVRYLVKPLVPSALFWLYLLFREFPETLANVLAGVAFLCLAVLLNSRWVRNWEEVVLDQALRGWNQIRTEMLPALFHLVMDWFKQLVEVIDRGLYAVDEWLRFKQGENRGMLAAKAALGVGWSLVAYIVRFVINLLVEPQVNPIKHFPVVTVSHKLVMTLGLHPIISVLETMMEPAAARSLGVGIATGIPGIFGFLVWEFRENWRLYRANQPGELRPVIVGHHGETIPRFLRLGFHSGTLPKLFGKLRRAERQALRRGKWKKAHKLRHNLHHAQQAVRRFVERELVALLNDTPSWRATPLRLESIGLASKRITLELACSQLSDDKLVVALEEQAGYLVAGLSQRGWVDVLEAARLETFRNALAGLYKLAGVDLTREQLDACFDPRRFDYDVTAEGLRVWPHDHPAAMATYDLAAENTLLPRTNGTPTPELPTPAANQVLFNRVPITWQEWVHAWENAAAGKEQVKLIPDFRVV
jgi:hypothetical protein